MALTIKNPETISLARQLADELDMTQTGAITYALRRAIDTTEARQKAKAERVDRILHEIWATNTPEKIAAIKQRMDDLYDDQGLIK